MANLTPTQKQLRAQLAGGILEKLIKSFETNLIHFIFNSLAAEYNEENGKLALQKLFFSQWKNMVNGAIVRPELKKINKALSHEKFVFDGLLNPDLEILSTETVHEMYRDAIQQIENSFFENADKSEPLDED